MKRTLKTAIGSEKLEQGTIPSTGNFIFTPVKQGADPLQSVDLNCCTQEYLREKEGPVFF